MNYHDIIKLGQYLFAAICLFLLVYRWLRIAYFNRSSEEPIPFRVASFYNLFEVEGTDVPARRYFMKGMNRVLRLIITCFLLTIFAYFLPALLAKFGL